MRYTITGAYTSNIKQVYADYPFTTDLNDLSSFSNTATHTRLSSASIILDNINGVSDLITNEPAFSGVNGLQIEPPHTNGLVASRNFAASGWTKAAATVTADTIETEDPLGGGSQTADKITATGTTGTFLYQVIDSAGISTRFIGCFAKAGTGTQYLEIIHGDNSSKSAAQWFDIVNGTLGVKREVGAGSTVDEAGIIDVGDDWFFCWANISMASALNSWALFIAQRSNGFPRASTIGDTCYLWDAYGSLNIGLSRGYWSPVTTPDVASGTGAKVDLSIPASHFPLNDFQISFDAIVTAVVTTHYFYSHMTDANNGITIYWTGGEFIVEFIVGGVVKDARVSAPLSRNVLYSFNIVKSGSTGLTLDVNSSIDTDGTATAALPSANSSAVIGADRNNANHMIGKFSNIQVIDL